MKTTIGAQLSSGIPGRGFVLRRGWYTGEIDEHGIVWLEVQGTSRIPGEKTGRRVGVHSSKFSYLEEPTSAPVVDKRALVNAQIKAADKAAAARNLKS